MKAHSNEEIDILLLGGTAITVDAERRVIRDAGIAVKGEEILFVGKAGDASGQFRAKKTLDCKDKVLTPGLINTHLHYSHHLSKGLIPDTLGPAVQSNFTHTMASPNLTAEDEIAGAKALLLECLKNGTTTFFEVGSYHPFDILRSGIEDIGIKGIMGRRASDRESLGHSSMMESTDFILDQQKNLLEEFRDNKVIKPCVTIVGLQRFTDRLVIEAKKMADSYGVLFGLHIAAWLDEVNECRKRNGCRSVEHLEKLGVLDKNVVLAHMLYVNQKEVDILARYGTKVAWSPSAAVKLGYCLRFGRYPEMLGAGIPVSLGTDGSDCSNYHDMVREMNLAAVLYKDLHGDPEIMGAEQAIEMATINGAKALGMEDEIGSIEAGKKADIIIFDTNRLEWRPLYNEVQSLVYSASGGMVESVIINGKIVMDDRKVLTVDEHEIMSGLREREDNLKRRLKMSEMVVSQWKFV
jgi:5-methylthioadenosine/S-adenosylhomocysteine deaminase